MRYFIFFLNIFLFSCFIFFYKENQSIQVLKNKELQDTESQLLTLQERYNSLKKEAIICIEENAIFSQNIDSLKKILSDKSNLNVQLTIDCEDSSEKN